MSGTTPKPPAVPGLIGRLFSGMRFPGLFLIVAGLFLIDLVVPDFIPFIDEIILGGLTIMLGMIREKRRSTGASDASDTPQDPKDG